MTIRTGAGTAGTAASLSSMLKNAVVDAQGKPLGVLEDVAAQLRGNQYPLLTGLVVGRDGSRVFVPLSDVLSIDADPIRLRAANAVLRPFERRDSETLLKQDVLGHRLIDVDHIVFVKAYDIRLTPTAEGWVAIGLDVHKYRWFQFGRHENHTARDWHDFLLIGDLGAVRSQLAAGRVQRLKPAHIADLIEEASTAEQDLLLAQVHADPDLEANVFGELDDRWQAQLLKTRGDRDIADVLSRMRADDAADAVMDLPQDRRRKILDLIPSPQQTKVLALLGYHDATAGGLMGTDYLALSEERTIADALQKLREATAQQPEALTTIHSLHPDGTLAGTVGLVRALQLDPATLLRDATDPDMVVASPEDDVIAVTTRMADFNLLTLPVVDSTGFILGIITVDDALEAAIPRDWSQREPSRISRRPRNPQTP